MKAEEEIKEIFCHLKNLIMAHRDMGVDPPPISTEALNYLNVGASRAYGYVDRLTHPHSLEALRAYVGDCRQCKLYRNRTHLVFGEGSSEARLVFVGEGPGQDEDVVGRPFVGQAGKLLTRIIKNGMGLTREDVYICNVVKCHPPRNRDPERDEIEACLPFLERQLNIIRPEVICALGRVAGQVLLGEDFKITLQRGKWHSYAGIPLMPTFHPAYLLRNPSAKRQVWEDVQKLMEHLSLEVKKNA